jgi:hypothetical protein
MELYAAGLRWATAYLGLSTFFRFASVACNPSKIAQPDISSISASSARTAS